MTEALYTHSAYNIMYACRREKVQTVPARMGFEIGSGAAYLSEMQISVLEPRTEKEVMPAPKDPAKRDEWRKRISDIVKKQWENPEYRKKCSDAKKGKPSGRLGIPHTEEAKLKMSAANKGNKFHLGKPHSEATRKKISEATKRAMENPEIIHKLSEAGKRGKPWLGKRFSEEHCRNLTESHLGKNTGESNPNWNGGSSYEPYCPKFNNEFKERVRAFFGYRCMVPGCDHVWQPGESKLAVHHVNFRKDACCAADVTPLFVPVCHGSCHAKTNHNRPYWEQYFTEIINRDYGGKCYFTKEEMKEVRRSQKW